MSTHANRVKITVTSVASAGTGDITLNAASSGFRSFATAYGANATVDILITEGTAWEIARNCTYTHSGTTVSRGTLENSSTGSAVVFTADAVVSVIATAAFGNNAALNHVAGGDADTTMAVGNMYVTDMSAWATADRTYTLPATAAVGDRIGIMVTAGDASHELIIKPNTGDTINGGSAAAEWSRLFITGEVVILRCVTADSAWVVEYDGRIPAVCVMNKDSTTSVNNVTYTKINVATTLINPHGMADTTNYRILIRRAGTYLASCTATADSVAINNHAHFIYKNGSALFGFGCNLDVGSGGPQAQNYISLAAGDYLELYYYHNNGAARTYYGAANNNTSLQAIEIL